MYNKPETKYLIPEIQHLPIYYFKCETWMFEWMKVVYFTYMIGESECRLIHYSRPIVNLSISHKSQAFNAHIKSNIV